MDLGFLNDYLLLVIVGICLCLGYIIKSSLNFIPNKYIPLIMAVTGCILNIWINKSVTADVILGGMFSGLASTGVHQAFVNLIQNK
ncbi:phage holin family protein [Terrisporobacter glycolicus]|nr:phage holin family protein [Terrisporobacter glycolicus]